MSAALKLLGRRFGRLVVLEKCTERTKYKNVQWLVQCDCGATKITNTSDLMKGHMLSCGCWRRERMSDINTRKNFRHGYAYTLAYKSYTSMIKRCTCPEQIGYHRYGGRGIRVCTRWQADPSAFFTDMGPRPPHHSLDRIDNNGHYSCGQCPECLTNGWPANCRWATLKEQMNNAALNVWYAYQGHTRTISQWADYWRVSRERARSMLAKLPDAHKVTRI